MNNTAEKKLLNHSPVKSHRKEITYCYTFIDSDRLVVELEQFFLDASSPKQR